MSLKRRSILGGSISSTTIHDLAHNPPSEDNVKTCVLCEYSDTIAINNSILDDKMFYRKLADRSKTIALWDLALFIAVTYIAITSIGPVTAIISFLVVFTDIMYRVLKITGQIENGCFSSTIINLAGSIQRNMGS